MKEKLEHSFDQEQVKELREQLDFEYQQIEESNFLQNLGQWLRSLLEALSKLLNNNLDLNINPKIIEWALYILAGATLLFLIYRLVNSRYTGLFVGSRGKQKIGDYQLVEEDVREMNISSLLNDARLKEDRSQIIRLLYLNTLKTLHEKECIDYHIRKTNSRYITELKGQDFNQEFKKIAHLFEYIWYGRFQAEEIHVDNMDEWYSSLNSKIGE